jgi:DNA-binding transcriptional MerR regulator
MNDEHMVTVKQLANIAGVSIRTLHYYDANGLLKATTTADNRYRYYDDAAMIRLQQILFYKELGFSLSQIKAILNDPNFDLLSAMQNHRTALQIQAKRIHRLIETVDRTILFLKGKLEMKQNEFFEGFSEQKQKQYEQEIRDLYGDQAFEGVIDWNSYSPAEKARIKTEGQAIYHDLAGLMPKGYADPQVQAVIERWRQHLRYSYEPSVERMRGLANLYNEHPEFMATFDAIHPDLAGFMKQAINYFCDEMS